MDKLSLAIIGALLAACGFLLTMNLSRLNTISDEVAKVKVTTGAICQAMSEMGHPIVAKTMKNEKGEFIMKPTMPVRNPTAVK